MISFGLGFDKYIYRQPICFIQMSTRAIDKATCQDLGAGFYPNSLKIASVRYLCVIHTVQLLALEPYFNAHLAQRWCRIGYPDLTEFSVFHGRNDQNCC